MSLGALLHIVLHVLIPALVAWVFFRARWQRAWLLMIATMAVDLDHLWAKPVYAPNRCSIGFHPLHRTPAIVGYAVLAAIPQTRVAGAGLLIHMALDAGDCVRTRARPLQPAVSQLPTQTHRFRPDCLA